MSSSSSQPPDEADNKVDRFLFQQPRPWLLRTGGVVALLTGFILFLPFVAMLIPSTATPNDLPPANRYALIIVFGLAAFCTSVGYRLTFHRPNRFNSLLPPVGWLLLGVGFLVLTAFLGYAEIASGQSLDYRGVLGCVLFAVGCFLIAVRLRARFAARGDAQ